MAMGTISANELREKVKKGQSVELIDVRTPAEFREVHIEFARNIPFHRLKAAEFASKRNGAGSEPVYVICRKGILAGKACAKLAEAGLVNVVNVQGGTDAWDAAGLPVVRGVKMMSIERQVRIAAGSLVVFGAFLGFFVHPYWIGLSAFIGAGLIFAGVTDTCGMGMVLARMPWNQGGTDGSACK